MTFNRRHLLKTTVAISALPLLQTRFAAAQESVERLDELTILLPTEPPTLDPALTYETNGWSIVHSVYDSLVNYAPNGTIEPLLAESWEQPDPLTLEFRLRDGVTFHDGEALTSEAVVATFDHLVDPETASQVAGNFAAVASVEAVDELTVRFALSEPNPALLSNIAAWLAILPLSAFGDESNDFASVPVGTGPYRFVEWERGQAVTLEVNPDWFGADKGRPIADRVIYRFVSEAGTRVAELRSGGAGIIRDVPQDQVSVIEEDEARVEAAPVSGMVTVRIATDTTPFDDPRVRQALNHAVDVDAIVSALLGGNGTRLATMLTPTSLGYDADLAPFTYDPNLARTLLAEAGYSDGFETTMDATNNERLDVAEAIAGQLAEIGVQVSIQTQEIALFNQTWGDPEAAPLRFFSWRPMFDPSTLLGLVVSSEGFLSRYDNPDADALIASAATEPDPESRYETYRQLGELLHDDPTAIYLYDLTALYGVANDVPAWTARPDEYILPLVRG